MKVPCTYDCKNRSIYCHSYCEEYLKYRKLKDKFNNKRIKEIEFIGYSINASERMGVGRRI